MSKGNWHQRHKAMAISHLAGIELYRDWRGAMGRRDEYVGRTPPGLIRMIDQFCDALEQESTSVYDMHVIKEKYLKD